ncbi:TPA: hypothetical protein QH074_004317 [Enterobacter hormaechei subsp. steigerwaltii]|nr:hypothetical protein [Enterobacter hormaechei subsp. steigerwaltii]
MKTELITPDEFKTLLSLTTKGYSRARLNPLFPQPVQYAPNDMRYPRLQATIFAAYYRAREEVRRLTAYQTMAFYASDVCKAVRKYYTARQDFYLEMTIGHFYEDWVAAHREFHNDNVEKGRDLAAAQSRLELAAAELEHIKNREQSPALKEQIREHIAACESRAIGSASTVVLLTEPFEAYFSRLTSATNPLNFPEANASEAELLAFAEVHRREATLASIQQGNVNRNSRRLRQLAKAFNPEIETAKSRLEVAELSYQTLLNSDKTLRTRAMRRQPVSFFRRVWMKLRKAFTK